MNNCFKKFFDSVYHLQVLLYVRHHRLSTLFDKIYHLFFYSLQALNLLTFTAIYYLFLKKIIYFFFIFYNFPFKIKQLDKNQLLLSKIFNYRISNKFLKLCVQINLLISQQLGRIEWSLSLLC